MAGIIKHFCDTSEFQRIPPHTAIPRFASVLLKYLPRLQALSLFRSLGRLYLSHLLFIWGIYILSSFPIKYPQGRLQSLKTQAQQKYAKNNILKYHKTY